MNRSVSPLLQLAVLAAGATVIPQVSIAQTANDEQGEAAPLEEVIVTGTLIRGVAPTGSQLITVSRDAIEATGAATTQDLLASVPQVTTNFNSLPQGTADFSSPGSRASLRNFSLSGSQGTLVLLNGHRIVGAGVLQTSPDPSSIPVGAIDHVEVLPDGASATYGADAVGGVINIITRPNFKGAETYGSFGAGKAGYHDYDVSQLLGSAWDKGSAFITLEYAKHDNYVGADRDYYVNDLRPFGGTDSRATQCASPTLQIAGVSYAAPTFTAGTSNRCDNARLQDLYPDENRRSVLASVRQEITDKVSLFADAYWSERRTTNHQVGPTQATFSIPSTNPFFVRPAGAPAGATSETVLYQFSRELGTSVPFTTNLDAGGLTVGADVELTGTWHLNVNGSYGKGTTKANSPSLYLPGLTAAANGTTTATALDPFNGTTSAAVLRTIFPGGNAYDADQKLTDFKATVDGSLFSIWGGAVRIAFGAETTREEIDAQNYRLIPQSPRSLVASNGGSRRDNAAFVEINVPLVGDSNAMPGVHRLELSLAGRYDDYSDFGSTTNPKFALNWSPVEGFMVRGSASSSFQAPSLADTAGVDTRLQTQGFIPFFLPPGSPPSTVQVFIAGGTPELQPQRAHTYTFGFDLKPVDSGFDASLTYWHSKQTDEISLAFPFRVPLFTNPAFSKYWYAADKTNPVNALAQPLTQAVLNQLLAQFPVVDDANAPLTQAYINQLLTNGYVFDFRRKNLGQTTLRGLDFSINYGFDAGSVGRLSFGLNGTRQLGHDNIPGAGAAEIDLQDRDPAMLARASVNWNRGPFSGMVFVNYTDGWLDTGCSRLGGCDLSSFVTTDVRFGYRFEEAGFLSNTDLNVAVDNVFDRDPPFDLTAGGFANPPRNSSTLGRLVSLSIRKKW